MSPQLMPPTDSRPRVLPPVKPPRIIVEHFDIATYKVDQTHGYVEADCQHCGATIKGQKNVTSNFIQHMRRRHHDAYDSFAKSCPRAKRPRLSTASNPPNPATPAKSPPATAPTQHNTSNLSTPETATALRIASSIVPAPQPTIHVPMARSVSRPARPTFFPDSPVPASDVQRAEMTMETALVSATYRGAVRTPSDFASELSARTACQFYIKREDTQVSGSPFFRASYNYLATTPTSRAGLVAAAASALPLAAAAQKFSKPCLCIVPNGTPKAVLRKLTACDAKYELAGDTNDQACSIAVKKACDLNRTYVDLGRPNLLSGFTDAVAGYATLALELFQQLPHTNRVFVRGGNALLFSGVSAVLQRLGRGVKLIGVVLDTSLDEPNKWGDVRGDIPAATTPQPIVEDWAAFTDDVVRVGRSEMCAAVKFVFADCDAVLEPVGALAVAGAVKYARTHKLSHERLAAVVDSPLREFDKLAMIAVCATQADGSRCTLCVQRRGDSGTANGKESGLAQLMQELSGTAGGTARVTSLRFGGSWPVLLGLACDETTTAGAHVANLTSLGYGASDVTGNDLATSEAWAWGQEEVNSDSALRWGVFRVEVLENTNGVVKFLATERTDPPLGKVALSYDGGGVARLLVAAKGTEWQLGNLEREMAEQSLSVRRLSGELYGLRMLGCADPPLVEVAADGGNGDLVITSEGMEATQNAENVDSHNAVGTAGEVTTAGEENPAGEENATGQENTVGEENPTGQENATGDGEGLAATAEVGMSFGEGEGDADESIPGAGVREGEGLGEDAGDGAVEAQDSGVVDAVPSHGHEDDGNTEHGHGPTEDEHIHHEGLGSAGGTNENGGDNDRDDEDDVPPHDHHGDDDAAATVMSEAAVAAAAAAVAAGQMAVETVETAPPR